MTSSVSRAPAPQTVWQRVFFSCIALAAALLITIPLANRLDPIVGDLVLMQHQHASARATEDIVIVTITEETLASLPYRSPIDRGFLANVLRTIDAASPKRIGLDVLIDAPSEPEKDREFFTVLDQLKTPIVLARAEEDDGLTNAQYSFLKGVLETKDSGSILLQRDTIDGVVRHLPVFDNEKHEGFAQVLAEYKTDHRVGRILFEPDREGALSAFSKYPAHTISLLPKDWFANKTVLIGTDLPNSDRHLVPGFASQRLQDGTLSGVEVHAHILNQLQESRYLPILTYWQTIVLTVLATVFAIFVFFSGVKPAVFFVGLAAAIASYVMICYVLLAKELVLLPLIAPPISVLIAILFLSLARWWQDRSEREFLEYAFSQYVSKSVVRRLTNGNIRLSLGGEKRRVTYLFTDLEGFTSLSQSLPPEQMGALLNSYLDSMCEIITAHGATIDKIIGDAVVCFFGAPDTDNRQAEHGVKLALALDKFCEEFRAQANYDGISLGITRIGVHTGDAVVGNFGGKRFFDYTAIGDTVNIAARLESANRHLGTRICVSQSTAENCSDTYFRPLGELVLKGRTTSVTCLQPISEETLSSNWVQKYLHAYQELEAKSPGALQAFEVVGKLNSEDGPTQFHLDRLRTGIVDTEVTMWEK